MSRDHTPQWEKKDGDFLVDATSEKLKHESGGCFSTESSGTISARDVSSNNNIFEWYFLLWESMGHKTMTGQPTPPNIPPRNKALWSGLINHWFPLITLGGVSWSVMLKVSSYHPWVCWCLWWRSQTSIKLSTSPDGFFLTNVVKLKKRFLPMKGNIVWSKPPWL